MITLNPQNKTPIYEQIKEQIIFLIQKGVYKPDEQLPSIRTLAAQLRLNVNTVKRAFMELETIGITYSIPGKGIYVSRTALGNEEVKKKALDNVENAVISAKKKGISESEVEELVKSIYK
ncbi:MAG: GntR family transcriptional regulator [Eubacteriales bacterium]|nr:GntR family transcriptional regulator [Eubacteriales bacterium]MDD4421923.1 GntR family transcriptional regulator [Eubacteriales bacterium]HBR32053.1 GntR family transcriptional regulator [Clostridiales bacterium]